MESGWAIYAQQTPSGGAGCPLKVPLRLQRFQVELMVLMRQKMQSWAQLIDHPAPAETSILQRYLPALKKLLPDVPLTADELKSCSIQEGSRVARMETGFGPTIYISDETSGMETGTYKDLDACLIVAIALANGVERLVLSSGGNLGYSVARYASRVGLEVIAFQPATTLYKLDVSAYASDRIRLISVDLPEREVKDLALKFAERHALLHVPDPRWRFAASSARAMFLLENILQHDSQVRYLAQTVCAGYGPVGIFKCFSALAAEGLIEENQIPAFIGFQQMANAPMVKAWNEGRREIRATHVDADPEVYLEPGLYNTNPGHIYTRLFNLIKHYGGHLGGIDNKDYERYSGDVVDILRRAGIELTRRPNGDYLEKTGLLTGVGILKAIDENRIRSGESVVFLLTGGVRRLSGHTEGVIPSMHVDASQPIDTWVESIREHCGIGVPDHSKREDLLLRLNRLA